MAFEILDQAAGYQAVGFELSAGELEPLIQALRAEGLFGETLELALAQSVLQPYLTERGYALWKLPELLNIGLDDTGLRFEARLSLLPRVTLAEYHGLRIEVPPVPVPDEDELLEQVSNLQLALATETEVTRGIEWGDRVILDLVVTVADKPVPLSAKAGLPVLIEADLFFAGFAEGLLGHRAGDAIEVSTRLPLDYEYPAWRGREAVYNVFVQRVCSLQLPPLDENFPALCGKGSSHDEMMMQIYAELLAEHQAAWQDAVGEMLLAQLVPACELEPPDALVEAEQLAAWERLDYPALRDQGIDEAMIALARETWMKFRNLREQSFWSASVALVLRAVAIREGLNLDAQEWHQTLEVLAQSFGTTAEALSADMQPSGSLALLADRLILDKTLRWLVSQAKLIYEGQDLSTVTG
ncbi:MAG: hypothetical protein CVV27_11205 [Candidatus Melainabacteria bacterium HGW-Melainabacteria-1]|nr:MAG: hypothetical protein CVV27_11205 [Candidatus Melainabacteria bacterium HGW-Melainabacteria-1]